jgi:hypothetical protein
MKRYVVAVNCLEAVIAIVAISVLTAQPAHAYLDPGTGSYAIQVGIAGVLGAMFSLKMVWRRLRERLFGGSSVRQPMAAEDTSGLSAARSSADKAGTPAS